MAGSSVSDKCDDKVYQSAIKKSTQVQDLTPTDDTTRAQDTTLTHDTTQVQDSTTTYFAILAAKIIEAKMPPYIVNRIESQVSAVVFGEIESFYSTINKTM